MFSRLTTTVTIAFLLTFSISGEVLADATTEPRLQASDITWLGAFAIDTLVHGSSWFGYGGYGLTFYEDPVHGKTLYMEGDASNSQGEMAQIQIPATLSTSADWNSLPEATVLQNFADATDGNSLGSCGGNGWRMYGGLPYNGRMIWSGTCWYSYAEDQNGTHGASGFNLSATNDFTGWEVVGDASAVRYVSGHLAPIPASWQSLLGGPALSGIGSLSIIGTTSAGPAAAVFDPDDIGNSTPPHPAINLLHYGIGSDAFVPSCPLGDCPGNLWNLMTTQGGTIFPDGYRTVLFATSQGLDNTYCYGTTDECELQYGYPVCEDGKGPHTSIKRWQFLAYDANDLLAVKNGTLEYWEPQPYAIFTGIYPATFGTDRCQPRMLGITYDKAARRMYVSYDWGNQPTVQVFQVAAAPSGPDTAPPAGPVNLSVQ